MGVRQPVVTSPPIYYTYAKAHAHAHAQYHDPAQVSLAYRPLQLPLQHQLPAAAVEQHHHGQQKLSSLAAAGFQPHEIQQIQNFCYPQPGHQHLPIRRRPQIRQQQTMASNYQGMSDEEIADLQKQSNEYEPEVTGPLVGQRQPSTAITTEYASADPVFQAKTAALPQKYSHYRTVRGDGRCGWRAVAFGYFETLVHLGDANRFAEEEARFRSLSNVLNAAGFDVMLYEDFADMLFDTMRKVAAGLQDGTAGDILMASFNDDEVQNYVITHFRTLTAAWMKTHPQEYAPWILGESVDEFCNGTIMPFNKEIENVGLSALKDVCLSPAGITLEVLYLDRSEGDEVNMHRFSPNTTGDFDFGTIRLLYRPGHYDLLYTLQDLPPSSAPAEVPTYLPAEIPTHLQYASQPHYAPAQDLGVSDYMIHIPGMSLVPSHPQQGWMSSSSYSDSDLFPAPAPIQPCAPVVPTPSAPAPQPQVQPQPVYVPATPAQLVAPPTRIPQEFVPQPVIHAQQGIPQQLSGPFRRSQWELKEGFMQSMCETPFQTSIFRNSHFNTAHFQNPDFQPEEWRPEDEYITTSSRSSRNRSSG